MRYVIHKTPLKCYKCTDYYRQPAPSDSVCQRCRESSIRKVKLHRLGNTFSRVTFEGELKCRTVLTSNLYLEKTPDFIVNSGDNLYPDPITAEVGLSILKDFFLGEDWYVTDPVSNGQCNVVIIDAIMKKFPKKYKRFCRMRGWKR